MEGTSLWENGKYVKTWKSQPHLTSRVSLVSVPLSLFSMPNVCISRSLRHKERPLTCLECWSKSPLTLIVHTIWYIYMYMYVCWTLCMLLGFSTFLSSFQLPSFPLISRLPLHKYHMLAHTYRVAERKRAREHSWKQIEVCPVFRKIIWPAPPLPFIPRFT